MIVTRRQWSAAAIAGLSKTFDDMSPEDVRPLVENGTIELYTIDESWLALEWRADHLLLWAYQGKDAERMLILVESMCKARGVHEVRYRTLRRGMERLLARWSPRVIDNIERSIAL